MSSQGKATVKYTATFTLTDQDLDDLLVTALEGGSNYWYQLGCSFNAHGSYDEWRRKVVSGDHSETVFDAEDGTKLGEISRDGMIKAFNLMSGKRITAYVADRSVADADWADVWFQYAVMGKVVYG